MTNTLKNFIKQHLDLISEQRFDSLFIFALYQLSIADNEELSDVLIKSDVLTANEIKAIKSKLSDSSLIKNIAEDNLPFVTDFLGTDSEFTLVFDDDLSYHTYYINGKLLNNNRYEIEFVDERWNPSSGGLKSKYNINLSLKQIPTLFSRMSKEYRKSNSSVGYMSVSAMLKGWI